MGGLRRRRSGGGGGSRGRGQRWEGAVVAGVRFGSVSRGGGAIRLVARFGWVVCLSAGLVGRSVGRSVVYLILGMRSFTIALRSFTLSI